MNLIRTKAKAQPEVLFFDHDGEEKKIKEVFEEYPKSYNHMIDAAQGFLCFELEPEQKKYVIRNKWPAVISILKSTKGFPNATDEFILEMHGIKPEPFIKVFNEHRNVFISKLDSYDITENGFVAKEELKKEIREWFTIYIKNDKQAATFAHAKIIAEAINNARKAGVVKMPTVEEKFMRPDIKTFGTLDDFLKDYPDGESYRVVPDVHKIQKIKE